MLRDLRFYIILPTWLQIHRGCYGNCGAWNTVSLHLTKPWNQTVNLNSTIHLIQIQCYNSYWNKNTFIQYCSEHSKQTCACKTI